jgi:hypothetical protein
MTASTPLLPPAQSAFSTGNLQPPAPARSTVATLRLRALATTVAIVGFAALAIAASLISASATGSVESNTAPSLVGIQDLFASVAESNSAATGAFLSASEGSENRLQRSLYLDALARATGNAEQVASLVGDNEASHVALREILESLTEYSGQIEAARLASEVGDPRAVPQLRDALVRTQAEVASSVDTVTAEMQAQLDDRSSGGRSLTLAAIAAGVVSLIVLLVIQRELYSRTKRLLNPPLILGTLLILLATTLLISSATVREVAVNNALDGGYDSITTTAQIQRAAYALQSESNLALLGNETGDVGTLEARVQLGIEDAVAQADSVRETAAASQLRTRWERYVATSSSDADLQFSSFNGLNTSIESVLSDNKAQFTSGIESAADAVRNLVFYVLGASALALLASLYGIQLRLREYS